MRQNIRRILALAILLVLALAVRAAAGEGCCAHCGCADGCQKVCRLVEEDKKVETICWGCKCEDFCVHGPSKRGCKHCKDVCETCDDGCDCEATHAEPKKFVWYDWIPGCAKVHTRKKLMKKVVVTKVPSFKWVVEDLCPKCDADCESAEVPPGVELPAPPAVNAKVKQARATGPVVK
jgi:hypothetical protein